ncbi:TonB-dependent receptor [Carboxylicivirga sp. A043]|uniref:SusC/RagA family TonB-linked outer membrane protein n=1 Tax=Carboxylicivirga litoralis TaxID=2816963 RepID=UPI0021CB3EAE|nr:TonB-dependent receptor [Carboxylicivirga sp. A043]MCU4155054.1 TonB-dependent receptor [Carboxylicivirga sp. A043]
MKRIFNALLFMFILGVGFVNAQNQTVTGTITDAADGSGIPGATIMVKGTTVGTITMIDGTYTLEVPADAQTLVYSFVGMTTQEVAYVGQAVINIVLETESIGVEEVVVSAYGTKGKVGLKGAISVVEAKDLEQMPVATFDQMLQGKTTGLHISTGSGQPGSGSTKVRIRGSGSITSGNEPLYVVDGVPIESGAFASLNANDFETVSVLKDASSTAIYGSRASNGVILITTKRGKEGKTQVNVRHQTGFSVKTQEKFDMMNSTEKLWFEEVAKKGPGWELSPLNPNYSRLSPEARTAQEAELARLRGIKTNWSDIVFRTGKTMSNEVNFSGGSEKTRFYVAYQNYYQEGLSDRSDMQRHAGRLNLDHKISDKVKFGMTTSLGQSEINRIESEGGIALMNPFAAVYLANPWEEPYDANGNPSPGFYSYTNPHLSDEDNSSFYNPYSKTGANMLDQMSKSTNKADETKFVGSFNLTWDIIDGLSAKTQYGIDYRNTVGERWISPDAWSSLQSGAGDPDRQGSISESYNRRVEKTFTNTLDYKKVIAEKHLISAVIGSEYIKNDYFSFGFTGYGLEEKLPETPAGITPGTAENNFIPTVGGSKSERALFSLFSMLNYTLNDKYTFSGSLRRDGSSAFGANYQYAVLYSAGVTWDITRENFMSGLSWVNNLKFRISYGTTGNQGVGNYESYTLWTNSSYVGDPAYMLAQTGDPNVKWEIGHKFNAGFDYNLFANRLSGSLDVYNDITSDLFIVQKFSAWDGVVGNAKRTNAGKVRNRGIEFLVNYDVIRNRNLTWTVGTNLSYNDNEILDLGQVTEFEQGTSIVREGLPLGSHYMVEWAGVNPANGNALYYTKNGEITEKYSADDNVAEFGTSNPPFTGGINTSLSYKGIELSAQFTFAQGFSRFNNQTFFQENPNFAQFNMSTAMLDVWQQPGDVTEIQGVHSQREFSSKDIEDASYMRFRNLMIAYNLPKNLLERSGFISKVRVYAQGQNLFTWTNWSGFDPEDSNNIASYEYPTPRVFSFGVDVSF